MCRQKINIKFSNNLNLKYEKVVACLPINAFTYFYFGYIFCFLCLNIYSIYNKFNKYNIFITIYLKINL